MLEYDNVILQDSVTNRQPLTISLTPELADFVATEVRSGQYGSASEVIRAGLRLLAAERPYTTAAKSQVQSAPGRKQSRAARNESRNG